MVDQASFSERYGYTQPKEILYRDDLSALVRLPILLILQRSVKEAFLQERVEQLFNPYEIEEWPKPGTPADDVLVNCEWFRLYDVIEDVFQHLKYHDEELREPGEEPQAYPLEQKLNDYFEHAGIGWRLADGKVIARGDDAFEHTVRIAEGELRAAGRLTAAERIKNAIRDLSVRPRPDYSGAISHATAAMECVLEDITHKPMTLGEYLKNYPQFFASAIKKALEGLWGYASEEGARHGKEGVEPAPEEADFVVSIAATLVTYLNRKHHRP